MNRLSYSSNGKESPAMKENRVHFLGWEVPLEKGMAIHSSILAWRISWKEEPRGIQSMRSQGVGHNRATNIFTNTFTFRAKIFFGVFALSLIASRKVKNIFVKLKGHLRP